MNSFAGSNPRDVRSVAPRMYEASHADESRCLVAIFKLYRSARPSEMCARDSPFYLAVNNISERPIAFKNAPIGVNTLYGILKRMVERAGIAGDRKLTNHSARKFLIQKLSDCNVALTHIQQISRHKNVKSINAYSHHNPEQQEAISDVLTNASNRSLPAPRAGPSALQALPGTSVANPFAADTLHVSNLTPQQFGARGALPGAATIARQTLSPSSPGTFSSSFQCQSSQSSLKSGQFACSIVR